MFIRKKVWLWFVPGFLAGFFVVHPVIMVIAARMAASESPLALLHYQTIGSSIGMAFSSGMLAWGLVVALLSGAVAALLARARQENVEKEKLKGVMELAGAACHELNQPLQVILGYAEIFGKELPADESLRHGLKEIVSQVERMDRTLKKIRAITRYQTREYIEGIRIIDIHKASEPEEKPNNSDWP